MEFLIRLAQCHFSFRQPELEAVATLLGINLEFVYYTDEVFKPNQSFSFKLETTRNPR